MSKPISAVEVKHIRMGETREKVEKIMAGMFPEPTVEERRDFAARHGVTRENRQQVKYWPLPALLEVLEYGCIQPSFTQVGKREIGRIKYGDDVENPFKSDRPLPQPEPEPAPVEESIPSWTNKVRQQQQERLNKLSDPIDEAVERLLPPESETVYINEERPLIVTTASVKTPQEVKGASPEALRATIRDEVTLALAEQAQDTQELITGVAAAAAGAVFGSQSKVLKAEIRQLVADLVAEARPVEHRILINNEEPRVIKGQLHKAFKRILLLARLGKNIALIGPTGCGKTHVAFQVAEALARILKTISCSGGMSESKLTGGLLPIGEGGKFLPYKTDLIHAFEQGWVFLADEWDAADPNTVLVVNQMLANGHIDLPLLGTIKRHPNFVFMASLNTYGNGANRMYAGRNKLDGASLDRFLVGQVEMDYDRDLEKQLCSDQAWLKECWGIRDKISEYSLQRNMSTRYILDGLDMIKAGSNVTDELRVFFSGWTKEDVAKVGYSHLTR